VDVNRIPSILLQTFLTVAEAGQISEAARRLHLSQPAVTGHIRRLEANLETTLFIRSANGVSLTERGSHLRERVQDVFAELEQILRELDRTRELNGTLTLAASTTVARYFVPRIFIRFHHYHPAAALHLIVGNTEEVLEHLRQQRVGSGWSRAISVVQVHFGSDATLVQSRVCLAAPIFTSARACGYQALARTPSQDTTHHAGDLAGSLDLSCVRGASLEETLGEDSPFATSMPATPATEVQPEDHRNALDRKVSQKRPVLAMAQAQTCRRSHKCTKVASEPI
jgi:DNA-binding transcriptional LysR family regulator